MHLQNVQALLPHFFSKYSKSYVALHNNVRHAGLCGIEHLLKESGTKATSGIQREHEVTEDSSSGGVENDYQQQIENGMLVCLDSSEPSIRQKALALLPLLATKQNVRSICKKIVDHMRGQKQADDYGREELIEKVMNMAERFSDIRLFSNTDCGDQRQEDVTFDWYIFTLVSLLQAAHGNQRNLILLKIKHTLSIKLVKAESEKSTDDTSSLKNYEEVTEVGIKLTGLLRKLVFNNITEEPPSDQKVSY